MPVISTVPGSAADCTRAAMLGTSPKMSASVHCEAPATTMPESMPTRPYSFEMRRLFIQPHNRRDYHKARSRGKLGIVVVRCGPAEIDHHDVTAIRPDIASVPLNGKNRRAMVIGNFLPPFFGIR